MTDDLMRRRTRRELSAEFVFFAGSVVLVQASRFVLSLVVARVVLVDEFAGWALFLAALGYAPSLLIGVLNGMGRELPYLTGAGRRFEARAAEGVVWRTLGAVAVPILLLGAAAAWMGITAIGVVLLSVSALLAYNSQQFAMRASLQFNRASLQQGLLGLLLFGGSGALLYQGHASFAACAAAYGLALATCAIFGLVLHPPAFRAGSWITWKRVQSIGFPIMLAGLVFSVFVTSDRWIATSLLGSARAGSYGLASVVGSAMLVIPSVISQQTYPRMAIAFGREKTASSAFAMARMQNRLALLGTGPIGALLLVAAWLMIPRFLPRYDTALLPVTLIVIGFVTMSAFTGYGNFLNVVGQQWAYLRAQLASAVVGIALMAAGAISVGPAGIALGAAVSYAIYGVLVSGSARRGMQRLGAVPTSGRPHSGGPSDATNVAASIDPAPRPEFAEVIRSQRSAREPEDG